jgi:peptidoglycan biosynthesis protein MviN/MurJ (putative lipid II flippase)
VDTVYFVPVLAYLRKDSFRGIIPLFLSDITVIMGKVTVAVIIKQCQIMQVQFPVLPRIENVEKNLHAVVNLRLHIFYILYVSL